MTDAPGAELRVNVLGPLEAWRGDEPVEVPGRVDRRVLAMLAATPGLPVPVATLSDVVYGAAAESPSLKYPIYRLRKLLGRDVIVSATDAYVLNTEGCAVDLTTFETRSSNGRASLAEGAPEAVVGWLEPALALWRGEPLPEVGDSPAVASILNRLTELRFAMQVELGAALAMAGRTTEAISALETVVADHPLREHAWVQLIAALQLDGRFDDAWNAADRVRLLLADSGLEPGAELREVIERLGDHQDDSTLVLRDGCGRPESLFPLVTSGPFAGRKRELSLVEDAATAAVDDGSARVMIIEGEPGVGKTRLAAEVARRAHNRGVPVWVETPAPYLSLSYGNFVGLVQHLMADVDLKSRRRLLAGPLARLVSDGAIAPTTADLPEVHRSQVFDAVADLIDAVCRVRGGVIVLDDMHESPVGTWQMLRHVVTTRPSAPACVIVTMRDQQVDGAVATELGHLRRLASVSTVRLAGLSADEVSELIADGVTPTSPFSTDDTIRRMHELTGGNPLYLLRLIQAQVDASADVGRVGVSTLDEAIESHLGMLSATCRAIMGAASVAGRVFSRRVLTAVATADDRLDAADVPAAIDEAIRAGIVRHDRGDPERLTFTHDLLRDALYRNLGQEAGPLHVLVGRAIERLAAGDGRVTPPAELAHHFAAAWPTCSARTAAHYLAAAGRASDERFEFGAADDLYSRALGLLAQEGTPDGDDVRAELYILAALARLAAEDVQGARAALSSAAALATERGWPDVLAVAAVNYADSFGVEAPDQHGADLLRAAVAADVGNTALRADVVSMLHRVDPERATAEAWSLVMSASGTDPAGAGVMLDHLWFSEIGDDQLDVAAEMIRLGEESGDHDLACLGELRSWMTGVMLGRRRFDDKVADRLRREVHASTDTDLKWATWVWMGTAAAARGDVEESMELAIRARELPISQHHADRGLWRNASRIATTYHTMRMGACAVTGDAHGMLESAIALGSSGSWRAVDLRCTRARVAAQAGQLAEAHEVIDDILRDPVVRDHPDADRIAGLAMLAGAAALAGHTAGIEAATAGLKPFIGLHVVVGRSFYLGSVVHNLGLLASAAGDLDVAIDYFTEARDAHRAVASDVFFTYSTNQLAIASWKRNDGDDRERAATLNAEVHSLAERIGMAPLLAQPWPPEP